MSSRLYLEFDLSKDWGEQLKDAYEQDAIIPKHIVEELVCNRDVSVSQGSGRWTESCLALFEYQGFYYGLYFEKGLTEYQETEYEAQVPKKYEKVEVKTYEYKEVK